MPTVLSGFLHWLVTTQDTNQSVIGRAAKVSQSVINKTMLSDRQPDHQTYAKIAAAYPVEWRDYFEHHPDARDALAAQFEWVLAALRHGYVRENADPQLVEAIAMTRTIFAEGVEPSTKALVALFLKSQMPPPAASATRRRPTRGR